MTEGRESTLVADGRLGERLLERVLEAAAQGPPKERIRNGLEAAIELVELDPEAARRELWALRSDRATLERLERCLGGRPERATLALGAAIQLGRSELASPEPDLRSRVPELLRWLEGDW
jgi:hypothetical protein